ncbi:MAG: hypothetical protein KA140_05745 [Caldisericia bacterium]|nr:hypothetical protein [Caldisericia bacterium]
MIGIFDSLKKMFRDNGPALIVYCVTSLLLMSMLLLPVLKIVEIGTSVEWKFSEHFFMSQIVGLGASTYMLWIIYIFFVSPFLYGYIMAMLGQDNIGPIQAIKACFSKYGRLLGIFSLYYVAQVAISSIGGFVLYLFFVIPLFLVLYYSSVLTIGLLVIVTLIVWFFYIYFIESTFKVCVFEAFFSKDTVVKAIDNSFSKTGKHRTRFAAVIFCCDVGMLILVALSVVLAFYGFSYMPIVGVAIYLLVYPLLVMSLCHPVYQDFRKQFDEPAPVLQATEQITNTNL